MTREFLDEYKNAYPLARGRRIDDLLLNARRYISGVVASSLALSNLDLAAWDSYLALIEGASSDTSVPVFCLNHDLVAEAALDQAQFNWTDGFEWRGVRLRDEKAVPTWHAELVEDQRFKVRLLKLHGSVNWGRFRALCARPYQQRWGLTNDGAQARQFSGGEEIVVDRLWLEPEMLIGTTIKAEKYTGSIFGDLHFAFGVELRRISRLYAVGYGFRDDAINRRLIDWLVKGDNRLIVVDPRRSGILDYPYAEAWKEDGKLCLIEKGAEAVSINELLIHL